MLQSQRERAAEARLVGDRLPERAAEDDQTASTRTYAESSTSTIAVSRTFQNGRVSTGRTRG